MTYVKSSTPSALLHSTGLLAFGWGDLQNSVAVLPHMTNTVIVPTKHLNVWWRTPAPYELFLSLLQTERMNKKIKERLRTQLLAKKIMLLEGTAGRSQQDGIIAAKKSTKSSHLPLLGWKEGKSSLSELSPARAVRTTLQTPTETSIQERWQQQ